MTAYIARRLLALIPILLGVTMLTFAIAKVTPGDPVLLMLGPRATPQAVATLRQQLGLNDPLWVQYVHYVWRAAHGDLGKSIRGQTPVLREILDRFPSTVQLTLAALALAAIAGVGIGLLAATVHGEALDRALMAGSMMSLSIPAYWLASVILIVFGVQLKWISISSDEGLKSLIFPALCLALGPAAVLARLTRSSVLDVINEDYVRTARAKGLLDRVISLRHVLPNALFPIVTVLGLQIAGLLGGAVFVESVFSRPGLGRFAVMAITARDYPQVQGVVLFTATIFVLCNLAVDVLYAVLDPRIHYA